MSNDIWQILELDPTDDARAIKRAYAKRLKQIDQATDLAGFQTLREAYEAALRYASHRQQWAHMETEAIDPEPLAVAVEVSAPADAAPMDAPVEPASAPPPSPATQADPQREALADIFDTLSAQGEAAALARLNAYLAQPTFEAIDARFDLEAELLRHLTYAQPFPLTLAEGIAEIFGWQSGDNPFKYDPQFRMGFETVLRDIKRLRALETVAGHCFAEQAPQKARVLDALFGPYDEEKLDALQSESTDLEAARRVMRYLNANRNALPPDLLSMQTFYWWERNVEAPAQTEKPPQPKHFGGFDSLRIGFVVLVLMGLFRSLSPTPNVTTGHPAEIPATTLPNPAYPTTVEQLQEAAKAGDPTAKRLLSGKHGGLGEQADDSLRPKLDLNQGAADQKRPDAWRERWTARPDQATASADQRLADRLLNPKEAADRNPPGLNNPGKVNDEEPASRSEAAGPRDVGELYVLRKEARKTPSAATLPLDMPAGSRFSRPQYTLDKPSKDRSSIENDVPGTERWPHLSSDRAEK